MAGFSSCADTLRSRNKAATWIWETPDDAREILCLTRSGARIFVDEELIMECPAGLLFVPAPHLCPEGSRVRITPASARHTVRAELLSNDPEQDAAVILTYPNFHLCSWAEEELPQLAILPAP